LIKLESCLRFYSPICCVFIQQICIQTSHEASS